MGCCSSKTIPKFPPQSTANHILSSLQEEQNNNQNPNDDEYSPSSSNDYNPILIIPQAGLTASNVAIYMPNDNKYNNNKNDDDCIPSYYFGPSGGKYKLYKVNNNGNDNEITKEEKCIISQGWQKSQSTGSSNGFDGFGDSDVYSDGGGGGSSSTKSASKTMTVIMNENGIEKKVKVQKSYQRGGGQDESDFHDAYNHGQQQPNVMGGGNGIEVTFDSGFEMKKKDDGSSPFEELMRDGMIVAKMYDPMPNMMELQGNPMPMKMLKFMQRPAGILINSRLSENEMLQILSIIVTANDRLLKAAQMDISSGNTHHHGHYDHGYGHHNSHNNHYGEDEHYGNGDGGGDYGGGGGDYGGGGDDGGGGGDE